ncbi:MAG: hypothetical protein Q9180_000546 [Flavoplaca navasiana]
MTEFIELGLEAASPIINNYDKVTDPALAKAKERWLEHRAGHPNRHHDDRYDDDDYYRRHRGDRSRRDRDYYDDPYDRRDGGRARSTGRDSYGGRGLRDDRRRRGTPTSSHPIQLLILADSRRSYSSDSSESSISPRRAYKHRKSLGEQALAALGLGGVLGADHDRDKDRRGSDRDRSYRRDDRDRAYNNSNQQVPAGYLGYNERQSYQPNGVNAGAVARRSTYGDSQSTVTKSRNGDFQNARGEKRESSSELSSSSSSDVGSSSEDERRMKKMKGKEIVTASLAAVATIHAAHGLYSSMEARDKRHAEVASGEMSPEQAAKLRRKAQLQDAAAIGIAALGIKGAYSEWQGVKESREEVAKEKAERKKRHEKRMKKLSKHGRSVDYGSGRNADGRYRSEPDLNRGMRDRDRDRDRDRY